jgi:hypothetical protein
LKASHTCARTLIAAVVVGGAGLLSISQAVADPADDAGSASAIDQAGSPINTATFTSPDANPAAVDACGKFAAALDGASDGYGNYADSLDEKDPSVDASNTAGRTTLRQSAGAAMDAANTPGLSADIADPMRAWSMGAAKLVLKMGLHMTGDTLDSTATEVNNNAEAVQRSCAAAGTHA